jgi:hypothetical protein
MQNRQVQRLHGTRANVRLSMLLQCRYQCHHACASTPHIPVRKHRRLVSDTCFTTRMSGSFFSQQVIELGQLGQGRAQPASGSGQHDTAGRQAAGRPARLYVHTQRRSASGDASAVAAALQDAGKATQQASFSVPIGRFRSLCLDGPAIERA